MRILRLFLYFVIGLMLSMAAGFSFAANVNIGTYYQYGNQISRRVTSVADQQKLSQQLLNVYMADSKTVGITTQFAYNMESNLVQGRIIDTIKADSGIFTQMAETTALGGLKAGLKGGLGAIAASLLADYLTTKGYEWMDDAKCQVTAGCSKSGWNHKGTASSTGQPTIGGQYRINGSDFPSLDSAIRNGTDCGKASDCKYTTQWIQQYTAYLVGLSFTINGNFISTNVYVGYWNSGTCPQGYGFDQATASCLPTTPQASYSPASPADVKQAADDVTIANIQPMINAIAQDGTTVPIPDASPTSTSGSSVSGAPKTKSSTRTNPDGSTTTENETTTPSYSPQGDGTTGGPIKVITNNTTNTTTNTCTASGSCSTTNNTTNSTPETPDAKTDCDKYPDSIGCASFGTPADSEIPSSTQSTSLSWTALSVPSICPPDMAVTYMGHAFSLSFKYLCQFAQYIKAMVIVSALIAAYFICFGARKETT